MSCVACPARVPTRGHAPHDERRASCAPRPTPRTQPDSTDARASAGQWEAADPSSTANAGTGGVS
eukprot:5573839-Alexandrium_andersonii.AAC.1